MGRVALVVVLCMVAIFVWYQSVSSDPSPSKERVIISKHQKKRFTTTITTTTAYGTKRPLRRMLLQLRQEELQQQTNDQNPGNHTADKDFPVHVELPIPTSKRDPILRIPRNKLIMELPQNSSCSSPLNWLCHSEEDKELCANRTRCNSTNAYIIGGLQAHTVYVLKKHNVTISDCDWETNNCSGLQKNKTYRPAAIVHGLEPGPLDVMWSSSDEKCLREVFYLFKLTVEDNPELKGIHERKALPCRSVMCVRDSNEKDGGKAYDVQMRVRSAEQVRGQSISHEDEKEMCAQWRMLEPEQIGGRKVPATLAHVNSAWMSGLWTGVGACTGLSLLTIIAICFQKRSVAEQPEQQEQPVQEEGVQEVLEVPLPPEVPMQAQMEALGLDTEPLLENEVFPPSLCVDDLPPVSRPRTPSYTLTF